MEHTNIQSITDKPWYTTLYQDYCRKLVLQALAELKQVHLIVNEPHHSHQLGDPNSQYQATLTIHDRQCYSEIVRNGDIGMAKAYINHWWSSPDLTQLMRLFARSEAVLDKLESNASIPRQLLRKFQHLGNRNSKKGAKANILAHYDLGNHLYSRFLDSNMMYSAAIYSEQANDLDAAQQLKLETICQRLELSSKDHLLEIGSGWGGLAIYAASEYGCKVTTTTISDAQYDYALAQIKRRGLSDKITLLKQDYRDLQGQYDKLVSIEMIEAVGHQNFDCFFSQCNNLLKKDGRMLLQAITIADQRYERYKNNVDFIQHYIFPGGCLPSISAISHHIGINTTMIIEQLHDIGQHYARTMADWRNRFDQNWHELSQMGFDDNFKRLWHYYLSYCEAGFLERATSTVHVVARK